MRKIIVATTGLLLLLASVAANSFGTYSSSQQKQVQGLEAGYTIGMFNLGSEPLDVRIEHEVLEGDPEDISVVHPTTVRLENSEARSDTAGEGPWFHLGDGRYARVKKLPISVYVDRQRSTSSFRFQVTMSARPESDTGVFGTGASQTVVQERSYSYTLDVSSPRVSEPGNSQRGSKGSTELISDTVSRARRFFSETIRSFSGGSPQETGSGTRDTSRKSEQDPGERDNSQTSADGSKTESLEESVNQGQASRAQTASTGSFIESAGADPVTLILLLMMAGSTVYLARVTDIV